LHGSSPSVMDYTQIRVISTNQICEMTEKEGSSCLLTER